MSAPFATQRKKNRGIVGARALAVAANCGARIIRVMRFGAVRELRVAWCRKGAEIASAVRVWEGSKRKCRALESCEVILIQLFIIHYFCIIFNFSDSAFSLRLYCTRIAI